MEILTNTTFSPLTTTSKSVDQTSLIVGYACMAISVTFFGVFNLPVKHFKTGDGMFFQLLVGLGIWSVGLIVHFAQGFPEFYALPMLGGFFWATANLQTVPTIKMLGIGISQTINNLVSLVFGWAYARFGWFGIKAEVPRLTNLNYIGVIICALSVIIYFFVDVNTDTHESTISTADERTPILNSERSNKPIQANDDADSEAVQSTLIGNDEDDDDNDIQFYERLGPVKKKILGSIVAIIGGIFFGSTFAPIIYCQSNYPNASQDGNDYTFSLATGVMISSMFYFIIYCIYKRNRPVIYQELFLPSFTTGWLWAIGNLTYLIATNTLSQAVTFPISFSGPSIIASVMGLFYKEITGRNNILVLLVGISVTLAGIVVCALSF